MLGDFLFRKAIDDKFGEMSPEERDAFLKMIDKNQELFMAMAREFQQKVSAGKSQEDAAAEVMKNHESELRAIDDK